MKTVHRNVYFSEKNMSIVITKTRMSDYMISNGKIMKINLSYSEAIAYTCWFYKIESNKVRAALITARVRKHDMVIMENGTFRTEAINYTNILK